MVFSERPSTSFRQSSAPNIRQDYTTSSPVHRGHGEIAARRLKIYAFDPQLGRRRKHRISIEVPYEELESRGDGYGSLPAGRLVSIVDYDAGSDRHYPLIDLDSPELLAGGGLEPQDDNPKFHQQMLYAVTMKVVANFERALGRHLEFDRLTVLPHAFRGRNAFFDPTTNSLCFGYFQADPSRPGENLPSQWIFTCLSNDIIAHEMTHVVVHRLRPYYFEATNPDVFAFHEAIADIVAIFQHFALPGVLADAIQESRGDLNRPGPLLELARQFGHSTGTGEALRRAYDVAAPDPLLYQRTFEPHDRGSVLVRAVFDAFFATYAPRVEDLIRLATGGTGILGTGYLHPDLANRLTREAGDTAQRVLDLCIRAFEFLPPIDVTFSDFLRALVTADTDLHPDDPYDLRANLVDAFFARGIHPEGVFSLNEESLLLEPPDSILKLRLEPGVLDSLTTYEAQRWGDRTSRKEGSLASDVASRLHTWYTRRHTPDLGLVPEAQGGPIQVRGFHTMFRVGDDGQLLTEAAVQFVQTPSDVPDLGGLTPRAGATLVFSGDGTPRYLISKPLRLLSDGSPDPHDPRMQSMRSFVEECDERDPYYAWAGQAYDPRTRMSRRFSFAFLHHGIETRRREGSNGQ